MRSTSCPVFRSNDCSPCRKRHAARGSPSRSTRKGRLIASDQGPAGLFRVTPPPIGSSQPTRVERLDVKLSSAQGLLFAFDALIRDPQRRHQRALPAARYRRRRSVRRGDPAQRDSRRRRAWPARPPAVARRQADLSRCRQPHAAAARHPSRSAAAHGWRPRRPASRHAFAGQSKPAGAELGRRSAAAPAMGLGP